MISTEKTEKFVPLLGEDFSVAFQLHLSVPLEEEALDVFEEYEQKDLTYKNEQAGKYQIFIPPQTCEDAGGERGIIFPGELRHLAVEEKIVFRRKVEKRRKGTLSSEQPRIWMMAARKSEEECFTAFSSPEKGRGNQNFVHLLFSSTTKPDFSGFEAVYIKTKKGEGDYCYFRVEAQESSELDVCVSISRVSEEEAPIQLLSAVAIR